MSSLPRFAPNRHALPQAARKLRDKGLVLLFSIVFCMQFLIFTVPDDILTPPDQQVYDAAARAQGNPVARTIKLALLVLGASILIGRQNATRGLLRNTNRPFLIFLGLIAASYLWSIAPPYTLARFVAIMSIVLFSAGFCLVGWYPRRFQDIVRPSITMILVGSILLGLYDIRLVIEVGVGTLHNAWHGLTNQKNVFGPVATLGAIFWLHAFLSKERRPVVALAGFVISVVCVRLSRSSSALMATVFVIGFMLLLTRAPPWLRRFMPYLVGAFVTLVLTYAMAILKLVPGLDMLLTPITELTGKDQTFSNRSEIWQIIKDHVQLHPLLGTGYGAYWIGAIPSSPSYTFLSQMWFYPGESHNGYLEVTNDLGFVGLAVLIAYMIVFVRQSLQLMKYDRPQGTLYLALFFQQALMNLSEAAWMQINSFQTFCVMTFATFALARALQEQKAAARAPAAAVHPMAGAGRPIPITARVRPW